MLNRRKFVASTALLAASPLIAPSIASARSASDRITLGFIGVGKQSLGHLNRFLSNQDVEVVAVCDVVQDRIDKAIATVHEKYAERTKSGEYKGLKSYGISASYWSLMVLTRL